MIKVTSEAPARPGGGATPCGLLAALLAIVHADILDLDGRVQTLEHNGGGQ